MFSESAFTCSATLAREMNAEAEKKIVMTFQIVVLSICLSAQLRLYFCTDFCK